MVLLDLFNAAEQCPRGTSEDRDPRRWGGGGGGGGGQRIFKAAGRGGGGGEAENI